jgi:hypothetical protein
MARLSFSAFANIACPNYFCAVLQAAALNFNPTIGPPFSAVTLEIAWAVSMKGLTAAERIRAAAGRGPGGSGGKPSCCDAGDGSGGLVV